MTEEAKGNRPAEAREHVRRFHELFFTLSPEISVPRETGEPKGVAR